MFHNYVWGTMQFGWSVNEQDSHKVLSGAWDEGINFIDTADIYSRWVEGNPGGVAETYIGKWLKKNKIPRDQLVLATKVRGVMGDGENSSGLNRKHIMHSIDRSLTRLQTDYIDLYQAHWIDHDTPIEETLRAFDDLIHMGKIRFIGCSNYSPGALMESLWKSEQFHLNRYQTIQPSYSIVNRRKFETENEKICRDYDLGVIPYSPLAGGFLTGKYQKGADLPDSVRSNAVNNRYINDKNWEILDAVRKVAHTLGVSVSQVSLAWILTRDVMTSLIIGPRNLEQLTDNLGALEVELGSESTEQLNTASTWEEVF